MKVKAQKREIKFNKRAAKYDGGFEGKLSQKAYGLVLEAVEIHSGDKVLDMGCGTGAVLSQLEQRCDLEGYGMDIEAEMIKQAAIKCPRMTILQGDCSKTPFQNEFFDSMIACMTFHHFYDQTAFAKEASRVLKQGGRLYLADPYPPNFIRKWINAVVKRRNLVGKLNTEQEILRIFEPHRLVLKEKRKNGFFRIWILQKTN